MWVIKPTLKGFWLGNSSNHLLTNILGNFLWNTKPAFGWLGSGLSQRFAKPPTSVRGFIGSNPIPSVLALRNRIETDWRSIRELLCLVRL